jgi:hypothetical protein
MQHATVVSSDLFRINLGIVVLLEIIQDQNWQEKVPVTYNTVSNLYCSLFWYRTSTLRYGLCPGQTKMWSANW